MLRSSYLFFCDHDKNGILDSAWAGTCQLTEIKQPAINGCRELKTVHQAADDQGSIPFQRTG